MERLSDRAIEILNELHTERLDYNSEYLPLVDAIHQLAEYEDAEEQGLLKVDFHAAWQVDKSVQETMGKDNYVCSHCKTIWASSEIMNMHYCPTCGAKMDLKESLEQALKERSKTE